MRTCTEVARVDGDNHLESLVLRDHRGFVLTGPDVDARRTPAGRLDAGA